MKRRDFLTALPLLGGATALGATNEIGKKKSFRVAHLTDIHVKPGEIPEKGMAKALQAAQLLKPKPDFIINSGDSIMDALEADKSSVANQWKLFHAILKQENSLPM